MLALLFTIGEERYGLDVSDITEVVPLVELPKRDNTPAFLAGEFSYRGTLTPVVDLSQLTAGKPCPKLLSSRIILVLYRFQHGGGRIVGLLAEKVTETARIAPELITLSKQQFPDITFKTPLTLDGFGTVQLLHPERLLPPKLLDPLFNPSPA